MPLPTPQQIGQYLEQLAKNKKTIFYSDLVAHFSLPSLKGTWSSHPLSEIFETLDQQDTIQNRPFRTSVVITKEGNMPGNGFFEALFRLKNTFALPMIYSACQYLQLNLIMPFHIHGKTHNKALHRNFVTLRFTKFRELSR